MDRTYFRETQKMKQVWIWIVIILIFALWTWAFIQQIIMKEPFGNHPASDLGLILIGVVLLIPLFLITQIKLITEISRDGIFYKMTIFMLKFKQIKPEEIEDYEIRTYKPVREYGGWGYRLSFRKKKGMALSMQGKTGLQLELTNAKKILIGTQKPEEILSAMNKLIKSKSS